MPRIAQARGVAPERVRSRRRGARRRARPRRSRRAARQRARCSTWRSTAVRQRRLRRPVPSWPRRLVPREWSLRRVSAADMTMTRPTRAEDFLELVERGQARPAQALHRLRRRRGQDVPHAGGGARPAEARRGRGARLRRDPRARRDRGARRRPRGRAAQADRVPRRHRRGDGPRRGARAQARGRGRRRAGRTPTCPAAATASATRTCSSCSTPASTSSAPSTSSTSRASTISSSAPPASTVRETVPDSFLKQADQVVNLDLAVEDLLERLRAGKIYAPEKVAVGAGELLQGREPRHAARARAARGGREPRARARDGQRAGASRGARRRRGPGDGVHVLVSAARATLSPGLAPGGPAQHRLVRRLRGDAERGARPHRRRGAAAPARQHRARARARAPRWCGSRRTIPVHALLDFARSHGVGHIIIGRSHQPWWRQLLGRSVPLRLVREARRVRPAHRLDRRRGGRAAMSLRTKLLLAQLPLVVALVLARASPAA